MTLYEEYISGWKDFESDLLIFNEQSRKKILSKLRKEKNSMNFRSRITEVNFGLFYAQNGAMAEYEKKYQIGDKVQEPDWTITLNNQTIISEVLRLNPTQKDQTNHIHVQALGNLNYIDIDKRRLESSNSEFYKKIDKYSKLIEINQSPFIISIYIDIVNGIDEEDIFSFLYGSSITDMVINSVYTDLSTGLFYNNINAQKLISGVMVRLHKTHTYFHNYSTENKLNSANRDFLINLNKK